MQRQFTDVSWRDNGYGWLQQKEFCARCALPWIFANCVRSDEHHDLCYLVHSDRKHGEHELVASTDAKQIQYSKEIQHD